MNPYPRGRVIEVANLNAGDQVDLTSIMGRRVTGIMTNSNNNAGTPVSVSFIDDPDMFIPIRLGRGIVYGFELAFLDATTVPNADIVVFS